MIRTSLAIALVALLGSACAAPKKASAPAEAQAKKGEQKESDLVCLKEKPVGTHFPKTVCYTREELGDMSAATQDSIRQAARGGVSGARGGERGAAAAPSQGR